MSLFSLAVCWASAVSSTVVHSTRIFFADMVSAPSVLAGSAISVQVSAAFVLSEVSGSSIILAQVFSIRLIGL